MNLKNIITISQKELASAYNSTASYIVLVVFLVLWEFLFFRNAFLVGEASLRGLYDYLPWLLLILVPALTMGSFAKEKDEGTLELLLTHPLKSTELIIGKFLGSVGFIFIALLFVIPIAFSFGYFGGLDWGIFGSQFLAGLLFASALISLGLFISSLLSSQISALLVSAASGFLLIIVGSEFFTANLPLSLAPILERISLSSHFFSMTRGVIDLRDLWYFLTFIFVFLSLAYWRLLKNKYGNRRRQYRSFQVGIGLFIGITVLTNIIGSLIPGRIDLTREQVFTLAIPTREILANLNDLVTVTLYASSKLPAQYSPILRDTKDVLRDYQTLGRGNVVVVFKDPSQDPKVAQEARSLGIQEVQFNIIGNEEFQLKTGYVGLAVSYGGNHETIPFIQDTSDLEYQLTSFVKKLTTLEKKTVAFLEGHGEKNLYRDYQLINSELSKQFETKSVTYDKETSTIATDAATLVIAGSTQKIEESERAAIKDFLSQNKTTLFLIDSFSINPQQLLVSPNQDNLADFLKDLGITVNQDLAYDLRANETVRFGGGLVNYLLPYPYWVRALVADPTSPATAKLETVLLPWTSSLDLDEEKIASSGYVASKLLVTTKFAGTEKNPLSLVPDETSFPQDNLQEELLAVSLRAKDQPTSSSVGRIIVVGSSNFLTDQFVQNSPENLIFGIAAISWLSEEESLSGIHLKKLTAGKLIFQSEVQVKLIKYGNLAIAVILPVSFGAVRLTRRRRKSYLKYQFK